MNFKSKLLALSLLISPALAWSAPKKLFLSIGINAYDENYWRELQFANKDAQDFAKALQKNFDGGKVLTDVSESDHKVQKSDILVELSKLAQENRAEDDVIIVYISAHGTVGRAADGKIEKFLVTSDSQPDNLVETALSHTELMKKFNALKSRRKVLILDSCYSGGGKSRLTEAIMQQLARSKAPFFKEPEQDISEGTVILAASAWGEEADESPKFQNGLYTYFLIQGFDRDFNSDGAVSITEAHQFATQQVVEISKGRQHPSARMELVGQDPIIIRGNRSNGSPLLFAYEWVSQKMEIEINGKKMGNLSKGGLLVPEGTQRLILRDESGNELVNRHVKFERGREYPLSQFVYEDPTWSIRADAWFGKVLNKELATKALPGVLKGYQIEMQKEEAVGTYDLQLRALALFSSRDSIQSGGTDVDQDLKGYRVAALLGKHMDLNKRIRRDWYPYLSGQAGLAGFYLSRQLHDRSFNNANQSSFAPGLALSTEFGVESLSAELQVGLRLGAEFYQNTWNFGPGIQSYATAEVVLGWIW